MADVVLDDVDLPPPIAAYDLDAPVYTLGSTAKLFWAGMRVGWVRSPADSRLADARGQDRRRPRLAAGQPAAGPPAAGAPRGGPGRATRRAASAPRPPRQPAPRAHLPDWTFTLPPGGLSLWCTLPRGNAEEFAELAGRHGVVVVPGPALSVDEGNRRSLRLVYAGPDRRPRRGRAAARARPGPGTAPPASTDPPAACWSELGGRAGSRRTPGAPAGQRRPSRTLSSRPTAIRKTSSSPPT